MNLSSAIFTRFDPYSGQLDGASYTERRLSQLRGAFADEAAYDAALAQDDPVIYTVATLEPAQGEGQLNYALGMLNPGRIGAEYYLTKGHYHAWRPAAECYIGLGGQGVMLLEDGSSGQSKLLPLLPNSIVYVPGYTAHRTINTGDAPLIYWGIYPAAAGHDYGAIAQRNFHKVVVAVDETPTLLDRLDFLNALHQAVP